MNWIKFTTMLTFIHFTQNKTPNLNHRSQQASLQHQVVQPVCQIQVAQINSSNSSKQFLVQLNDIATQVFIFVRKLIKMNIFLYLEAEIINAKLLIPVKDSIFLPVLS